MAPSSDCSAVTSLLCAEEDDSIFHDDGEVVDENDGVVTEFEATWDPHRIHRTSGKDQTFNGGSGFPLQGNECLALMVERESEHSPRGADYLRRLKNGDVDLGARQEAVKWIGKVCSHFNFGPLCAYLSTNYLDRFLSAYEIPKGKPWMMQLLAVACLSVAAKMEETEVPLCVDLQVGESKFVFEARTILRMELLLMSTLNWRMQAVTPFSFIDNFLSKINGDQVTSRASIFISNQLILSTLKGIDFLEFRPSEVAAAVAMSIAVGTQTVDAEKAISVLIQHVEKERLLKCTEMIHESSVPQSPIGVLDAACLSYGTDDSTVGSCANSSHNTPDSKRRKLNGPCEV